MTEPKMPVPDTTVYGKDRFTAPKHAYFHENVLALNKAWGAYHAERIAALEAENASALAYSTTLAKSMHRQHYADVAPNWQPLPDVVGVLTQIDNMYAGVRDDLATAEHENARLVGANLASLKAEVERLRAALEYCLNQNEHDMVLTGDEIRNARAALAAKDQK